MERQLELLRTKRIGELDVEHMIEEVEELARSRRQSATTRLALLVRHLLKLEHSPSAWPRRGWRLTVQEQRTQLSALLSARLSHLIQGDLPDIYADARERALLELEQDGVEPEQVPESCPYTLDEMLDRAWWPANVHGLTD